MESQIRPGRHGVDGSPLVSAAVYFPGSQNNICGMGVVHWAPNIRINAVTADFRMRSEAARAHGSLWGRTEPRTWLFRGASSSPVPCVCRRWTDVVFRAAWTDQAMQQDAEIGGGI